MQLLFLDNVKVGMILAKDIISNSMVVIIAKNTIITKEIIKNLQNLNIENIYVKTETVKKNKVFEEKIFLNDNFNESIETIRNIFNGLKIGSKSIKAELDGKLDPLINRILKSNDILSNLRNVEYNEDYILKHSINVSILSVMIGKWMNLSNQQITELAIAGILHDVGKTKIPKYILNKSTKLSDEEYNIAKKHAIFGYEILFEGEEFNENIILGVLTHHERYDGSGYPDGLKGKKISLYGRIIAIADIFDSMTSDKVYKDKVSQFEAAETIKAMSFDKLDPKISNLFVKKISEFYVGNKVLLSTGEKGEIVYVNKFQINKPLIKVNNKFIDLTISTDITITKVL